MEKATGTQNNSKNMYVGFDLGRYSVQISYYRPGMDEPQTAEQIMGSGIYNIPMVLYKRRGVNQWFYGREALKNKDNPDGFMVDNLLQRAIDGGREIIDGTEIDGTALLTLFIKRSLSILGGSATRFISDIMFTCPDMDAGVIDVMSRVASGLQLRDCNVSFQDYAESIYHYIIHQEKELWRHDVLCSWYDGIGVTDYIFRRNMKTTPIVTFVDTVGRTDMPLPQIVTEDARQAAYDRLDGAYTDHIAPILEQGQISGVYLLGDGFKDEWYSRSVRVIARNRRVFLGNDLFSKGAAYGLIDRDRTYEEASKHIFLGDDKLRSNVGMNVLRRGKPSYLALLDAGVSWYDVHSETEFFLPDDHMLRLEIIPLDGSGHIEKELELINVPERDPDTLRVKMTLTMSDLTSVQVHIEDLGFGEFHAPSGMEWDMTVNL